jgi:hypothetical protein
LLRKAFEDKEFSNKLKNAKSLDDVWKELMLAPIDYSFSALFNT